MGAHHRKQADRDRRPRAGSVSQDVHWGLPPAHPIAPFVELLMSWACPPQPLFRPYHRVSCVQPDPALGEAVEAEERARLAAAKAALAEEQVAALISATQALRERQETPDPPTALATIPALDLGDIPREAATIPSAHEQRGRATLLRHELFTNSVLYAEAVLDLRRVPEALLPLVPLFSQALLEGGTQDLDFVQLNQLIGRKTGGISAYPLTSSRRGSSDAVSHFVVKGKGMAGQAGELLGLMRTVLQDVQFADPARFKQWVSQAKARMEARVVGGGHSLAASRIDAKDSSAGWVAEAMGGASYLGFLRQLEQRLDGEWEAVRAQLEEIRGALLSQEGAIINLTADEKTLAAAEGPVSDFLSALPEKGGPRHEWGSLFRAGNEALVVPTQVRQQQRKKGWKRGGGRGGEGREDEEVA
jgi:Zn-dependent M16 (insulinase) family peptidase